MRENIRGYTDAVIEQEQHEPSEPPRPSLLGRLLPGRSGASDESTLARMAEELAAVSSLLDREQDLRRVLSDPGVGLPARRAVVSDLFGSQVGTETLRLLTYAVEADRATEFAPDVAWLAVRIAAARDGLEPFGEVVLGRLTAAERIEGYAVGVLDQVDEAELGELEDELFRFMRVVDGSAELRTALTSRDLSAAARRSLVTDLLGPRATPATTRMATYATQVGRPRDYIEHLAWLVERVAEESNRRVAEVRAFTELDDDQRRRLGAALTRLSGRTIEVRVTVDPTVLGGFVATIGDTVVDGSARHRLDVLKDRLVLPEATITTTGEPADG